ncbi:hypothetical protein HU200_062408 [Digitaria exilis]|uniref:Uncharacterized protein n=1 Tax=Digitaria exilis TaxID=1010633 RepID=A0A835A5N0_9POAL|nr:hypothetical protein HU200_062408 [Digitaria exilis]
MSRIPHLRQSHHHHHQLMQYIQLLVLSAK